MFPKQLPEDAEQTQFNGVFKLLFPPSVVHGISAPDMEKPSQRRMPFYEGFD